METFPEILAWVKTCYAQPSHLLFGSERLSSQRGFHQGDPLAALLFALVLHPIVLLIQERVPDLTLNTWYLDDGTQVGKVEDLQKVMDILVTEGPARGLILSTSATVLPPALPKTTIWSPSDEVGGEVDPLDRGIVKVRDDGVILLGAPIGSEAFVGKEIEKKVAKGH